MRRLVLLLFCCVVSGPGFPADPVQELQQLLEQKQYAAAAKQGEELLQDNPGHAQVAFLTAYAYQMGKQPEQAAALYQQLIRDHPELPEPRNNLAIIYLAQGDYDRASQLLVDAINSHASYATAYDNLSRIYKGIASEAYRRAVSESDEPAKYTHDIELAAITGLTSVDSGPVVLRPETDKTLVDVANLQTLLIEQVKRWAEAWSNKDFAAYTDFYAPQFSAKLDTHEAWLQQRRERILRAGSIRIEVSDIKIRRQNDTRVVIDFKQAFDSPTYSDRVVKRLGFSRIGSLWKITDERVLSIL